MCHAKGYMDSFILVTLRLTFHIWVWINSYKGKGQNYYTQTGPTTPQKDRWSLHVPPFPHLERWCLVCIAPTLSGLETKKKIQTALCHSPATQTSCTPNMKVSIQILRPINFVHLANQTGGILHSPPTSTQGGSSSSTLVMTTSLIFC